MLPKGQNKEVIGLMKDKLGGQISYLTGNKDGDKKVEGIKKFFVKRKHKF